LDYKEYSALKGHPLGLGGGVDGCLHGGIVNDCNEDENNNKKNKKF
jgi:hypothetical protein